MQTFIRVLSKNLVVAILGIVLVAEIFSIALNPGMKTPFRETQPVLRISEIAGPRIDDGAAMVVVRSGFVPSAELFVFLLVAFIALLLFNFSYTFETTLVPQWRLEGLIMLSAVFGWLLLDPERVFLWFPFAILKSGLILFAGYVYLLEKKQKQRVLRKEPLIET